MSDGSDGVGSAVCFSPLERRDLLGFVSSLEQRERERERERAVSDISRRYN